MTTSSIPANYKSFFYRIAHMQEYAKHHNHAFQWGEEYTYTDDKGSLNKSMMYNCAPDADSFLKDYYNRLHPEDRHCYEIVQGSFYMYFDLDFDIEEPTRQINEVELFVWFRARFMDFISYHKQELTETELLRIPRRFWYPEWIVTTASNDTKLSLHLVNRSVIFSNMDIFKQFYNEFSAYLKAFIEPSHPFSKGFDRCVASNNRAMRLTGSTKLGNNRVLRPLTAFCPLDLFKIENSFITNAKGDPKSIEKRIGPQAASQLFCSRKYTEDNDTPTEDAAPGPNNPYITRQLEYPDLSKPEHLDQVRALLQMLKDERAENYNEWRDVGFLLHHHQLPYELFDEFSKRIPSKYSAKDCRKFWDSIPEKEIERPLTLGTLHFYAKQDNPKEYAAFCSRYQEIAIDLPFTPDTTIDERFISKHTYLDAFANHDLVALKSNMMTGKTYSLPDLVEDPTFLQLVKKAQTEKLTILIPYFRVTLSKELQAKWKERLGAVLYSDIKGLIDLDKYPVVIVQIDSIHRVIGKPDLLILDELESTASHLCSSKFLDHQRCFNTLRTFIQKTPKVLFADANLQDATIRLLAEDRMEKCHRILNTWKSFTDRKVNFVTEKDMLRDLIVDKVKQGKRLAIPTNSKNFSKYIHAFLHEQFPDKRLLLINGEGVKGATEDSILDANTDHWKDYDILIYTPTIVAGQSFDLPHFHLECAYFTNKSCDAEMSSQMLFRVRNLIDKELFICAPRDDRKQKSSRVPLTEEDIQRQIDRKIREGHSHYQDEGLDLDHFEKRVHQNQYFRFYCNHTRKKNLSGLYFKAYLTQILKTHGIQCSMIRNDKMPQMSDKDKQELVQLGIATNVAIKNQEANEVILAKPLTPSQFEDLYYRKREKTRDENLSITRYFVTDTFGLRWDDPMKGQTEWMNKNLPHLSGYSNLKQLPPDIDKAIRLVTKRHAEKYEKQLLERASVYQAGGWSSDSDTDDPGRYSRPSDAQEMVQWRVSIRDNIRKRCVKQNVVHSIHYDRRWLKLKVVFEFLKTAGFTRLDQTEKVRLQWEALHTYCIQNEERIRALFDCKRIVWKENWEKDKQTLIQYINSKVENLLATKLETTSTKRIYYTLEKCFTLPIRQTITLPSLPIIDIREEEDLFAEGEWSDDGLN